MAGFGIGFGSFARSRQFASLGQNVPVTTLAPSALWNGTPGSGFAGAPPVDPPRTSAKPICRLMGPPNIHFTDELVLGVFAGANFGGSMLENMGLEKVIAHCEGARFDIMAPSFFLAEDRGGILRRYLGWWVVLKHPGRHGHLQVYFEAVPKDRAMQARVIGPFQFSPQAQAHDHTIEVAATPAEIAGQRYKSLTNALNYLTSVSAQNPLITITEGYDGDLPSANLHGGGHGYTTITATAPVIFRKAGPATGNAMLFRPRVDGLWFKGPNITFDFQFASAIYHENPANRQHVFEGVNFIRSGPRYHLYQGGAWPTFFIARHKPYYLECTISNIGNPCTNATLVRGCLLEGGYDDVASFSDAMINNTIRNWKSAEYRHQIDALRVHYTGPGATATIELSGGNGANNRVLTARVNGTSVDAFTLHNSEAAFAANTNYSVQNVADWLNTLPGWSATVLDSSRRAVTLSRRGNVPLGGAFAELDARTQPITLVTAIDMHSDLWQMSFSGNNNDNLVFYGNLCHDQFTQSVFFGASQPVRDAIIANNAFDLDQNDPEFPGLISQLRGPQSHVIVAHNTFGNQNLVLRADTNYAPDSYCLIANNVAPQINWGGTANPAITLANNHLMQGASVPVGSVGTVVAGTRANLLRDPAQGDFTPLGPLLGHPRPPVLRFDMAGQARGVPAANGALAGGEDVAPMITSSNPSATYAEGVPVAGRLTANKPVAWSVSGPDAGLVSLDPATGDWQIGATDFETRASYAFTFIASDWRGDTAGQVVSILISDLDEIAPVLSGATGSASGSNAAFIEVATNEGNGTIHWVVSQSSEPPVASAIIAGGPFVASGSRAIHAPGVQTVSISGLSPATTYFAHFLHRDAAGNDSSIRSSPAFATAAPSLPAPQLIGAQTILNTSANVASFTPSPFAYSGIAGRAFIAIVVLAQNVAQVLANLQVTANGAPMVLLGGAAHSLGASRPIVGVFMASGLAAGPVQLQVTLAGSGRSCSVVAGEVAGINLAAPLANLAVVEGQALALSRAYAANVAGNMVLSVMATRQGARGPFAPDPGMTEVQDISTGTTSTSDHTAFVGWRVAANTSAGPVGAVPASDAEAVFLVAELRADAG